MKAVLTDGQGASAAFPVRRADPDDVRFTVRIPVTGLTAGVWGGVLRLGNWTWALPPVPAKLTPAKWRRRGLPWYAKPAPGGRDRFALRVARTDLVKALTNRFR